MVSTATHSLTRWIAPVGALATGVAVTAGILLVPHRTIDPWFSHAGLHAIVQADQLPSGVSTHMLVGICCGLIAAVISWAVLYLLFGKGGVMAPKRVAPRVRRADAHPDAPPRRPMTAEELGTPTPALILPPIEQAPIEQALPANLDQPLATFDPAAVRPVPMEPVRAVRSLQPRVVIVGSERTATIDLPREPADTLPSIESLLRRLEQAAYRHRAQA